MIDLLLSLILPTIICSIPFVGLFWIVNLKSITHSLPNTIIAVIVLTLSNILASTLAIQVSIYGITRNLPKDNPNCVTGAGIFFALGVLLGLLTFVFGLIYMYRNYKLGKIYRKTLNN